MNPINGHIYQCLKTRGNAVKGKFYVYKNGELKTYTTRNVTCLSNGDDLLEYGKFELVTQCPFCGAQTRSPFGSEWIHDGADCARGWDARVKKYCIRCGADTVDGKCPKCD